MVKMIPRLPPTSTKPVRRAKIIGGLATRTEADLVLEEVRNAQEQPIAQCPCHGIPTLAMILCQRQQAIPKTTISKTTSLKLPDLDLVLHIVLTV
jgi:hypothetical protein